MINSSVGYVISWGMIIAGWVIVHFLTCKREKEHKRKELYKDIRKLLKSIENYAVGYHTYPERQLRAEAKLIILIDELDLLLDCRHIKKWLSKDLIIELRLAVTQNNFQNAKFEQQQFACEIIYKIQLAVSKIYNQICKKEMC